MMKQQQHFFNMARSNTNMLLQGIVIAIDSSTNLIKVFIPQLHLEVKDPEEIPWIPVVETPIFYGLPITYGVVSQVPVYSIVMVMQMTSPAPCAVCVGVLRDSSTKMGTFNQNTYGFIDKSNNVFQVNTEQHTVEFSHNSGTRIKIDANGDVSINAAGNLNLSGDKINIKGSVVVEGDLSCDGVSLKTHTHGGVQAGSSNTQTGSTGGESPSYVPPILFGRDPFDPDNSNYNLAKNFVRDYFANMSAELKKQLFSEDI